MPPTFGPCHQLSVPDALSWTVTGALRHRWSLPYQRASEEGLKSELELRLESLCGWRRMRAAAPADPRISVRQVTLFSQLVYRARRSGRAKNCRRSFRTRRERALRHWAHRAGDRAWRDRRAGDKFKLKFALSEIDSGEDKFKLKFCHRQI